MFLDLIRSEVPELQRVQIVFAEATHRSPSEHGAAFMLHSVTDNSFRMEVQIEELGLAGIQEFSLIPLRNVVVNVRLRAHGPAMDLHRYFFQRQKRKPQLLNATTGCIDRKRGEDR